MKYKIGDRVKIKDKMLYRQFMPSEKLNFEGEIMTIKRIRSNPFFDKYYEMKEDNGFCIWTDDLIDGIADEHKIVITTDGKTTTAKLYDGKKFIKTATAKCSPEDEFDFKIGAELAFERLLDTNKGKYFTGKAVYTGGGTLTIGQTIGKTYEFKNGFYYDDDNMKRPAYGEGFTKDDVVIAGFLPIKE